MSSLVKENNRRENIRNIAVIAHVDHGKTTLIDALLKQTHVFRDNQQEMQQDQILDANDLERERGITILAKNCSVRYNDVHINIIDTPGHADFSGEIERTLSMADGAILIIDAQEGPMPQTRFVLKKAFDMGLKIIVVVNKVDKKFARVEEVINKTENLFMELATDDKHLDFRVLFAIAREGAVWNEYPIKDFEQKSVTPLLEAVINDIPAPISDTGSSFKMLVSSLDYDTHIGRIVIGRVHQGVLRVGDSVQIANSPGKLFKVTKLMMFEGLNKVDIKEVVSGDIAAISGIPEVFIGQTLFMANDNEPLPTIVVSEPTLHMYLGSNTSPFAGQEGEFTTSRQLEKRLDRELETNLSLRLKKLEGGKFKISGRGELHLSVLLETLRREGYEMEVGKPEVIVKTVDGVKQEPYEEVNIIVPNEHVGVINQELGKRYAALVKIEAINEYETEFVYHMPTRATIGLRGVLLTMTKGTVVFNSQVLGYQSVGAELKKLRLGALIADTTGEVLSYGLHAAQQRGTTFVGPGTKVYEGMIIGLNSNERDLSINVCKGKQLTNMRSSGADGILHIVPPVELSLEQAIGFLEDDELLEITPQSLRLRKKLLTELDRRRARRKN